MPLVSPRVDALAEDFLNGPKEKDGSQSPGLSPDVPELPEEYRARIAAQNMQVRQALEKVREKERDFVLHGHDPENPMTVQRDGVVKLMMEAEAEESEADEPESKSSAGRSPQPLKIKNLDLKLNLRDRYQMA